VRKLILVVLAILIAVPAYADTASELLACGINDVTAGCMADVMDESYGTIAADGSALADATAITKKITYVTASDNAKGVKFPTPATGDSFRVYNTVASKNLIVYPVSGGTINGGGADSPVTIYGKTGLSCFATSTSAFLCSALVAPTSRVIFIPGGVGNPAGHTGGAVDWVTSSAKGFATLAASATVASITIPVTGLQIGDTIVSFKVVGQFENTADDAGTIFDADLRLVTNAAAGGSDASLGTITQVAPDADAAITSSKTLGTAEVLASGEFPYVLIKATTGGSSDVELGGVEVTVYRDN
jgi:hypothetical protein